MFGSIGSPELAAHADWPSNCAYGMPECGNADGFALLGALGTLVVFGCLLLALTQRARFGVAAWSAQACMAGAAEEFVAMSRTLHRLIMAMDPSTEDTPAPLVAGPHGLSCISALPAAAASLRAECTLQVDGAQRLMLRWRPYLHATWLGPPPPMAETELTQGEKRLDLAYWRPGGGWAITWRGRNLPATVRICLVFAAGDPRHWSDLTSLSRRCSTRPSQSGKAPEEDRFFMIDSPERIAEVDDT